MDQHSHLTWKEPIFSPWHNGNNPYIWSSGNVSLNHIKMARHLYLIMWEHISQSPHNGSTLTSDLILLERPGTHIWPCVKKLHQNGLALISDHVWTHRIEKDLHLYPTMFENTTSEGLSTYSRPCLKAPHQKGSALTFDHARKHCIERALHLHLTMLESIASKGLSVPDWGFLLTDQVPPFSQRMASALIFDQVGTNPSITSEWPCTC